jgi:CRISPR-associated endonuclease/helicase Cas3
LLRSTRQSYICVIRATGELQLLDRGDRSVLSYYDLWAKTGSDRRWHALPFHLLDVAATAGVLWDRLPAGSLACPNQSLGLETAKSCCVFLAASHDIGKCNPYFQAKSPSDYDRLAQLGAGPPPADAEPQRHGQGSGAYLAPWLKSQWGWAEFTANAIALAVGGHHGTFFPDIKTAWLKVGESPWRDMALDLLRDLAQLLQPRPPQKVESLNAFLGWLAGFVSVTDWLGSHERMTVWQSAPMPLAEYSAGARKRAIGLLDELHWRAPVSSPPLSLHDFLPSGAKPNSMQQQAMSVAADYSLAVVEAPTGEGKTEAAFAMAEPARSTGAGVYFALPTMATANGLHQRVESYLGLATKSPDLTTRLLHSMAWLFRDDTRVIRNPGDEGRQQASGAMDWFAGAKRGLLAPYAVGTVDQPLIAALRARHGFVRLFALAGKVVVIDEVHAYDIYMADLLDVLLGWLAALNCRVVLLSATLPSKRRAELLRAWGYTGDMPASDYPAITWVTAAGEVQTRSFEVAPRKPLTFSMLPSTGGEPWQLGAQHILALVRATSHGQGALILNTVRDAQAAYDWLRSQDLGGIELDLFHARFTVRDRETVEKRALERFGKHGHRTRPAILVATQVVEQSLDLDFDHMVSALAPIDLLIQRAGRLHRHHRDRLGRLLTTGSDERPDPVLFVLSPDVGEQDVPELREPMYAGTTILCTHEFLKGGRVIRCARDVRDAVEAVYGPLDGAAASAAWAQAYDKNQRREAAKQNRIEDLSAEACIPSALSRVPITFRPQHLSDDESSDARTAARTRLEDMPTVTLVLQNWSDPSPTAEPSRAEIKRWVLRSVRTPAIGAVLTELLAMPIPEPWAVTGMLRFARLAILDEIGSFSTGRFAYEYSAERGLRRRERRD